MDEQTESEGLRVRLEDYMRTLTEAGVSEDFLVICAAEFIKEQSNADRRSEKPRR